MSELRSDVPAAAESPIKAAFLELQLIDPKWRVAIGEPGNLDGWIPGSALSCATDGPFRSLLERIAIRLRTTDRRTVAASFALRFGWTASAAIAPFLTHRCVPHVSLSNISLKFRENTLFERTALHQPTGLVGCDRDPDALVAFLREELFHQAEPVVEALYDWSGFSRKGSWGMITSSWASQFIDVCGRVKEQVDALPLALKFFQGNDEVTRMQPRLHPVSVHGVTHVYQRRASCCRYYLLPQGDLCASCPLVSDEERIRRNLEWMVQLLSRSSK